MKCPACHKEHEPYKRNGIITNRKCLKCVLKEVKAKRKLKLEKEKLKKIKKRENKANSISVLKKKCWKLCSEYNRRKNANSNGMVECITCGKIQYWKKQQAGHFIPGRANAYLFDDRGIFAQCFACNCLNAGMWVEYEAFMVRTFGKGLVKELKSLKNKIRKLTVEDYKTKIEEYKIKLEKYE